jgi:DNA-binding phage protein
MTMPLETTLWDVTDGMETEQERLGFLFACLEEAPTDDAFFASAVDDVHRSRKRYGTAKGHQVTIKRIEKMMVAFPTVTLQAVARIVDALGYQFDIESLTPAAQHKRPARTAAKRTRSATRTQRRNA